MHEPLPEPRGWGAALASHQPASNRGCALGRSGCWTPLGIPHGHLGMAPPSSVCLGGGPGRPLPQPGSCSEPEQELGRASGSLLGVAPPLWACESRGLEQLGCFCGKPQPIPGAAVGAQVPRGNGRWSPRLAVREETWMDSLRFLPELEQDGRANAEVCHLLTVTSSHLLAVCIWGSYITSLS